jgi:Common central domain of tyrosinase
MRTPACNAGAGPSPRPRSAAVAAVLGLVSLVAACEDPSSDDDPSLEPTGAAPVSAPSPTPDPAITTKTSALTSAVGRLYFKHNGQIAVGVDTDGNMFTPSVEQGGVGPGPFTAFPGLVFKQNGTALYGFEQASGTDPDQLGRILIRNNFLAELVSTMPLPGETGVLLLKNAGVARAEFDHLDNGGSLLIHKFIVRLFKYRKSAIALNPTERQNFVDALLFINGQRFGGADGCGAVATGVDNLGNNYTYKLPGHVSFYAKSDEAHANTKSHGVPNLLPWHRSFLAHLEGKLRAYDPTISLPYWDWESTPHGLLMDPALPGFMGHPSNTVCGKDANGNWTTDGVHCIAGGDGSSNGWHELDDMDPVARPLGLPWAGTGVTNPLYDPTCSTACSDMMLDPCTHTAICPNPCRENLVTGTWNTAFNPKRISQWSSFDLFNADMSSFDLAALPTYEQLADEINVIHVNVHSFLGNGGGDLGPFETSARVPLLFLMHANIDRIWAGWQSQDPARSDPNQPTIAYGAYASTPLAGDPREGILTKLEPWADNPPVGGHGYRHSRPFLASASECLAPPMHATDSCTAETVERSDINSRSSSILTPPLYQ